ncbi:uncharacterized protein LOC62_01G000014 [Vanrija pseudolonga]|uniref:Uncharacterized protein n=1 Tax=Vanrija pseudolonga TaxID=143232 RepID=A0AAF0XYZ8_9TREE|nr:hypothetical protein LOC62_01G000014 [Vanrija pseudolonga]
MCNGRPEGMVPFYVPCGDIPPPTTTPAPTLAPAETTTSANGVQLCNNGAPDGIPHWVPCSPGGGSPATESPSPTPTEAPAPPETTTQSSKEPIYFCTIGGVNHDIVIPCGKGGPGAGEYTPPAGLNAAPSNATIKTAAVTNSTTSVQVVPTTPTPSVIATVSVSPMTTAVPSSSSSAAPTASAAPVTQSPTPVSPAPSPSVTTSKPGKKKCPPRRRHKRVPRPAPPG